MIKIWETEDLEMGLAMEWIISLGIKSKQTVPIVITHSLVPHLKVNLKMKGFFFVKSIELGTDLLIKVLRAQCHSSMTFLYLAHILYNQRV